MSTVLITGGHTGLGLEAAKQLAASKLDLLLAGRNLDKVEIAAKQIRSQYGIKVTPLKLDLSSLASVREAAESCRAMLKGGQIDSLQAGDYPYASLQQSRDCSEQCTTRSSKNRHLGARKPDSRW